MDEERRKVQDMSLATRNARAAMSALENQNKKLYGFEQRLNELAHAFVMMEQDFRQLKSMQINQLIEKMGHGPTAE